MQLGVECGPPTFLAINVPPGGTLSLPAGYVLPTPSQVCVLVRLAWLTCCAWPEGGAGLRAGLYSEGRGRAIAKRMLAHGRCPQGLVLPP